MYLGFGYLGYYQLVVQRFLDSKLNERGYLTLTIASQTLDLLYVSKICDHIKTQMPIFLAEFSR